MPGRSSEIFAMGGNFSSVKITRFEYAQTRRKFLSRRFEMVAANDRRYEEVSGNLRIKPDSRAGRCCVI